LAGLVLTVVGGLQFCRRDVAAVFVESSVVEPIDVFGGGVLNLFDSAPRLAGLDSSVLYGPLIVSAGASS